MFSTSGDVQYIEGIQYIGGYHDYTGGYHGYIEGCLVHRRDIMMHVCVCVCGGGGGGVL